VLDCWGEGPGAEALGGGGWWQGRVPKDLILVVLNAVKLKVLTTQQGADLCDLYSEGDKLVRVSEHGQARKGERAHDALW
jgi:hypothetical protein